MKHIPHKQTHQKQKRIRLLWLLVLIMLATAFGMALMVSAAYFSPPTGADKSLLRVDVSPLAEGSVMTVATNHQSEVTYDGHSVLEGYLIILMDGTYHVFDGWLWMDETNTNHQPFLPSVYRQVETFCRDFQIIPHQQGDTIIQCNGLTHPLMSSTNMRWRLNGKAIDLVTRDLEPVPAQLEDGHWLVIGER